MDSILGSNSMNGTGLWIDETNAKAWSEACEREIAIWLDALAGSPDFARNLHIQVTPPSKKATKRAFDLNTTLLGEIAFRWFDETVVLKTPMSYHGVFLYRRDRSRHPLIAVWPSWLAEAPAFRIVRPTDGTRQESKLQEWRIGLPDGTWTGAPLSPYKSLNAFQKRRLCRKNLTYLGTIGNLPAWLEPALGLHGPRGAGKRLASTSAKAWQSIHKLILKKHEDETLPSPSDEDDLDHRVLMTFPVWLKHRISRGLLVGVLPRGKKEGEQWRLRMQKVLRGEMEGDSDLATQARTALWNSLSVLGAKLNWAINNYRSEEKADYIDPVNPLELVSRIMRVRRIHLPASRLEEKPAEFRQNHWSFQGRICPVESPESGQVGLTVHLSSGATVDFDGKVYPATTPAGELGFGAGLIPFYAHNDGARNMMGAKNMRQAIPVRNAQAPVVQTGGEQAVAAFAKPLVEAGLCPKAGATAEDFYLGRDLLVAYLPWHGMNFEDAIVLGQQVVDNELLDCVGLHKVERIPIKVGWVHADPDDREGVPGLVDGLVRAGTRLVADAPIACFKWDGKERAKQRVIRYKERTPAIVKRIQFHRKNEWTGGILEYELELPIPIRPGDKLMGRHGNKGVVAAILPEDQMPRLPKENLPAGFPDELRGKPIDILLNPHGVISRMNLGQLIETHLGWLLLSGRCTGTDIEKAGANGDLPLAAPFGDGLDHDKVQACLEKTGLDRYGRIRLVLPNNDKTVAPVVVGFQHIVRLRHIPELKSQARRGGEDALYAARTGQAIHGKKFGGGQRLGEMEIWALAAHQADAVLAEMLGIKSSADMIAASSGGVLSQGSSGYTGYARVLRDWLFALGIDLAESGDDVTLSFLKDDAMLKRIGKDHEVTGAGSLESRVTASFRCVMGKRPPCGYQLLEGEKIEFRGTKNTCEPTLTLGELLAHRGFRPDGKFTKKGKHFEVPLADKFTAEPAATLEISFEQGTDSLKAVAHFASCQSTAPASAEQLASLGEGMTQAEWEKPKTLPDIHLYGRFGKGESRGGGNWSPDELLEQFQVEEPGDWWKPAKQRNRCVTDMTVTCPHKSHRHQSVRGMKPFGEVFRPTSGGLFDPGIFGSQSSGFGSGNRWGYVKLPIPVKYPLHVFLTTSTKEQDQERALRKFLDDIGVDKPAIPELTHVPVLPIRYRLPTRSKGKLILDEIERNGYGPLLAACRRYREAQATTRGKHGHDIANRVEWLFRRLARSLEKKTGLIRRDGLGRRVDRSARLVVTPNPKLGWDHAGIPTAVLLELMGDLLEQWLASRSPEESQSKPLPELQRSSWMHPGNNERAIEDARAIFEAYFEANKDFVILLNRQPSLHRDSFQAFKPVPLPAAAGDVIQLCPLACKGFAADFDGDEMVVHVPLGAEAQKDACRLLPSENLFSLATVADDAENVLAHFDQDFVMGTWFLGQSDEAGLLQNFQKFLKALPDEECEKLAKGWNHPSRNRPKKEDAKTNEAVNLLFRLANHHRDQASQIIEHWMRLSFDACTKAGVSFGFYELREIARSINEQAKAVCEEQILLIQAFTREVAKNAAKQGEAEPDYNKPLSNIAEGALKAVLSVVESTAKKLDGKVSDRERRKLLEDLKKALASPGISLAAMALSGARGKKQVRQLIAARGMLDPGKTGFDPFVLGRQHFFFKRSLVDGLTIEEAFWAAMNARSSMIDKKLGTGYAGGLTRSMVFALWSFAIVSRDCGSTESERTPATCREKSGFCAKCYGTLPEGGLPLVGFPAGLIAAQSIGERGTQLSMQSFHAGKSGIDIHTVRAALNDRSRFEDGTRASELVNWLKDKGKDAYKTILDRHFQILWRVIHDSGGKTLRSSIRGRDGLTILAYRHKTDVLAEALLAGRHSARGGPIAKVMLGGFTVASQPSTEE